MSEAKRIQLAVPINYGGTLIAASGEIVSTDTLGERLAREIVAKNGGHYINAQPKAPAENTAKTPEETKDKTPGENKAAEPEGDKAGKSGKGK